MKALTVLFLVGTVLLCCIDAGAGTLNRAETSPAGKISVGFCAEFVNDRNLAQDDRQASAEELRSAELNGSRLLIKPSYAIDELVEVFVLAGVVKNDISTQGYVAGVYQTPYSITFDPGIGYGAGIKVNSDIDEFWFVGANAQLLIADDTAKVVKNPAGAKTEYRYGSSSLFEWQAAVFGARKLDMFTVFAGAKYFDAVLELAGAAGQPDINFSADKNLGLFVGVDIPIAMAGEEEDWTTSVEVTFADETTFGIGVRYGF